MFDRNKVCILASAEQLAWQVKKYTNRIKKEVCDSNRMVFTNSVEWWGYYPTTFLIVSSNNIRFYLI